MSQDTNANTYSRSEVMSMKCTISGVDPGTVHKLQLGLRSVYEEVSEIWTYTSPTQAEFVDVLTDKLAINHLPRDGGAMALAVFEVMSPRNRKKLILSVGP
jgi:hypothetical protein